MAKQKLEEMLDKDGHVTDACIAACLADMGCDGGKADPHWVPNTKWGSRRITPEEAEMFNNGYLCSVCGKMAYAKYRRCSGCGSVFRDFEYDKTSEP